MGRLEERIKALPGFHQYRVAKYRRRFEREGGHNLFFGLYESFSAALDDVPRNRAVGYNHADAAQMYQDQLERTWPEHYPVLFWLSRNWSRYGRILDYGGHRGALYYAARRLIGRGPDWYVYDLPAVVEEGRRAASHVDGLSFTSDLGQIPDSDLVVAAGSLQYTEYSARAWLEEIGSLPQHLIISTMPFHPTRDLVTLNNMGTAYCPYKVRHKEQFFDELESLGYRLVEEWHHPGKSCPIPFHVAPGQITYRGGMFELA